jgi:hypothetical protein
MVTEDRDTKGVDGEKKAAEKKRDREREREREREKEREVSKK